MSFQCYIKYIFYYKIYKCRLFVIIIYYLFCLTIIYRFRHHGFCQASFVGCLECGTCGLNATAKWFRTPTKWLSTPTKWIPVRYIILLSLLECSFISFFYWDCFLGIILKLHLQEFGNTLQIKYVRPSN